MTSDRDNTASAKPRRLGRGLSSLLGSPVEVTPSSGGGAAPEATIEQPIETGTARRSIVTIPIDEIVPSPSQPRQVFDEAALANLAMSIKTAGVMQPLLVRRHRAINVAHATDMVAHATASRARYELVAGERRWRACRAAGLAGAPCIVVELSDVEAAEWGLIENVQREDLGAMEKAWAFRRLAEQFGLTHGAIAEKVGLDRATVSNYIRLTELADEIQTMLREGKITFGHAKALLSAPAESRLKLAERTVAAGWPVRRLERLCGMAGQSGGGAAGGKSFDEAVEQLEGEGYGIEASVRRLAAESMRADLEKQLSEQLGTRVQIRGGHGSPAKGRIMIDFYSLDQFDGVLARMGVKVKG